ncbi:unnamed protein product, partial [Didymodactylos carnosus]
MAKEPYRSGLNKAEQEILNSIEPNYFNAENFDSNLFELQKLSTLKEKFETADVLSVKDRLNVQLHIVSKRVSKLVLENSSSYAAELQRVTDLTSSLQQSVLICAAARRNLKQAQYQMTIRNLGLIKNEMKKQQWTNLLSNMKNLKKLHGTDKRLKEMIKITSFLCPVMLNRFLKIIGIEESIDVTMARVCYHFNEETYQRLLVAYRLLEKSSTFMDQLQMHFINIIQTRTIEIVLKTVETGTKINETALLSSSTTPLLNKSYVELCKLINDDTYLLCLNELNMCMWQVIKSYRLLYLWHEDNPQTQSINESLEPSQVYIMQKLENGSVRLWNEIQQKIKIFLIEADITNFKFEQFIHILKVINRLMEIGEQFCRSDSTILTDALRRQSVNYFRSYHSTRLDELKLFLENESWEWCPVKTTFHITQLHEFRFLLESSSITSDLGTSTSFNQKQEINLFEYYLQNDKQNPFDIEHKRQSNRGDYIDTDSIEDYRKNYTESSPEDSYDEDEEENEKRINRYHESPTQDNYRGSRLKYHDKTGPAIVTNTTLNVTRLFGRYMQMINVLKPIAFDVIICMTQLFDYYLYTVYSLFACDMNEIPLDALGSKLRFTIKRISDNLILKVNDQPSS